MGLNLIPSSSESGGMGEWVGLDGKDIVIWARSCDWAELSEEHSAVSVWHSGLSGSKVVTVPQLKLLWRRFVLPRGTQGSWKVLGESPHRMVWSLGGLPSDRRQEEDERGGLTRPGRRLRESERSGGGGGLVDLRSEMLRPAEREQGKEEDNVAFREEEVRWF